VSKTREEPFSLYRLQLECEYPRCPARAYAKLGIRGREFQFCFHHSNNLLELAGKQRLKWPVN
jgi:hypothetical protein